MSLDSAEIGDTEELATPPCFWEVVSRALHCCWSWCGSEMGGETSAVPCGTGTGS